MKKLSFPLSILLCFAIFFTLAMPVWADKSLSVDEKAQFLEKAKILTSTNGSYSLTSKLKRSDAAVLVVKLIGKADEVASKKDDYSDTGFSDIPASASYAPYVGYCLGNDIVKSSLTGKYNPDTIITEKSFLIMVLRALGYTDSDFSWNTIYKFSYSRGLLTQDIYKTKTTDSATYYMKDAVNVLFNALVLEKKAGGNLIQCLITAGLITRAEAINAGLIKDTVKTGISGITAVNENKLVVKFNETLTDLNTASIKIYETLDATKKLTVISAAVSNDELTLQVSSQTPDKVYTIELSGAKDEFGNVSAVLSATFKGYKIPEIISDFFKISKAEPINKNVINLYFTQPINQNAEIPTYYEITDGASTIVQGTSKAISVKRITSCDNGVAIYLKDNSFTEGVNYSIKVNGSLCSAYGVKLKDGAGDNAQFIGKGADSSPLSVTAITPLSGTKIAVDFNKEIDQSLGQKFLNYTVKGPNKEVLTVTSAVIQAQGDKKGKSVILTLLNTLDKTKQYELTVEYLPDAYRQSTLEGYTSYFTGLYSDISDLGISFAGSYEKTTVNIYFNKNLDPQPAINPAYYIVRGVSDASYYAIPEKVTYSNANGQAVVKLYMPASRQFSSSNIYKVTVVSMTDASGINYNKAMEYTFKGGSSDLAAPTVSEAKIISADTIKLKFSAEIAEDISNLRNSNYYLDYKADGTTLTKIPVNVLYIDSQTIVLRFDSIDPAASYTLRIAQIKGCAGNTTTQTNSQQSINVSMGK